MEVLRPPNYPPIYPQHPLFRTIRAPLKGPLGGSSSSVFSKKGSRFRLRVWFRVLVKSVVLRRWTEEGWQIDMQQLLVQAGADRNLHLTLNPDSD